MAHDSGLTKRDFLKAGSGLPALKLLIGAASAAAVAADEKKFTPVALTQHFTTSPSDFGPHPGARSWSAESRRDGLLRMPGGSRTFRGIPFLLGLEDVTAKSWVVLSRAQKSWTTAHVEIPIGQKVQYLCLAQFCDWDPLEVPAPESHAAERVGQHLADIIFLLDDGTAHSAPIRRRFEVGAPTYPWGHLCFNAVPQRSNTSRRLSDSLKNAFEWGDLQTGAWESDYGGDPAVDHPATIWLTAIPNPAADRRVAAIRLEARSDDLLMLCGLTLFHGKENPLRYNRLSVYRIALPEASGDNDRWRVSVDLGEIARSYRTADFDPQRWMVEPAKVLAGQTGQPGTNAPLYVEVAASSDATLTLTDTLKGTNYDFDLGAANAGEEIQPQPRGPILRVIEREKTWLRGTILDSATKKPTPVRLAFRSKNGRYIPPYGHRTEINNGWFQDYGADLKFEGNSFAYVDGTFQVELPVGEVYVELTKGFEYEPVRKRLEIKADQRELNLEIARFTDLRTKSWVSADTHVHFLSPSTAVLEAQAEGLNLINLLAAQWGDLFTNVGDLSHGPLSSPDGETIVWPGTENRQHILGHLGLLGGHGEPVFPMSASGPGESYMGDPLWTTLSDWADACRKREGLVVAVHFPYPTAELAAAIATSRIDAVELRPTGMTEHFNNLYFQEWYRYLNCGYRLPIAGGTDKMSAWIPAGAYRTYVHLDSKEFTFENWARAVRRGNTFLSSGPLLMFSADGHSPGDEIRSSGSASIEVRIEAECSTPIHRLDVIHNGRIVASREDQAGTRKLAFNDTIRVDGPGWIAGRCASKHVAGGIRVAAHTSPVYVVTPGKDLFAPHFASYMLTLIDGAELWAKTLATRPDRERLERVLGVFRDAREAVERRLKQHG